MARSIHPSESSIMAIADDTDGLGQPTGWTWSQADEEYQGPDGLLAWVHGGELILDRPGLPGHSSVEISAPVEVVRDLLDRVERTPKPGREFLDAARGLDEAFTPEEFAGLLEDLDEDEGPARLRWAVRRLAQRHRLTTREQDILKGVLSGRSNPQIGRDLEISLATVKWHMHNVFAKTNTNNRESLMRLALQLGGGEPGPSGWRSRDLGEGLSAPERVREVAGHAATAVGALAGDLGWPGKVGLAPIVFVLTGIEQVASWVDNMRDTRGNRG